MCLCPKTPRCGKVLVAGGDCNAPARAEACGTPPPRDHDGDRPSEYMDGADVTADCPRRKPRSGTTIFMVVAVAGTPASWDWLLGGAPACLRGAGWLPASRAAIHPPSSQPHQRAVSVAWATRGIRRGKTDGRYLMARPTFTILHLCGCHARGNGHFLWECQTLLRRADCIDDRN